MQTVWAPMLHITFQWRSIGQRNVRSRGRIGTNRPTVGLTGHGGTDRPWWDRQAMVGPTGHGGTDRPWWDRQAMVGPTGHGGTGRSRWDRQTQATNTPSPSTNSPHVEWKMENRKVQVSTTFTVHRQTIIKVSV